MKTVTALILAVICMTGCSFRDGAASTAAGVSSLAWSMFGVYDSYDDSKKYWDEKFKEDKLSETIHIIPGDNSTRVSAQNQ